jgi:hypothetical protein
MDFGPQRSPTSKYDFELEKRVLYALYPGRANRFEPIGMASELTGGESSDELTRTKTEQTEEEKGVELR